MENHPYIKLVVDEQLDLASVKLWKNTVESNLPSGVHGETEIPVNDKPKTTSFYTKKSPSGWYYIVPLTRDLSLDEVKQIAIAWHNAFSTGDFEIDYSSVGEAEEKRKDLKTVALKEIAKEAAKLNHNSWLTEMSNKGWRYGNQFNQRTRVNPNLLPWDQLSKKYQLNEMRRFVKLIEILHNMKLKLVRQ